MYLSCLTIVIDIVSYQPKVGRRVLPLFQRSIVLPTWLGMIAMLALFGQQGYRQSDERYVLTTLYQLIDSKYLLDYLCSYATFLTLSLNQPYQTTTWTTSPRHQRLDLVEGVSPPPLTSSCGPQLPHATSTAHAVALGSFFMKYVCIGQLVYFFVVLDLDLVKFGESQITQSIQFSVLVYQGQFQLEIGQVVVSVNYRLGLGLVVFYQFVLVLEYYFGCNLLCFM